MLPHTITVDFAIALLVVSVGADLLAAAVEERDLRVVAWWTLLLGTMAAGLSVVSGFVAASVAGDLPEVVSTIVLHRNLAIGAAGCFFGCVAWRGSLRGRFPEHYPQLYWLLSLAGLAALVLAAYLGGILVFRLGVGVQVV